MIYKINILVSMYLYISLQILEKENLLVVKSWEWY